MNNISASMAAASFANPSTMNGGQLDLNEEELNQIGNQILSVLQGFVPEGSGAPQADQEQPTLGQTIRSTIYGGDALLNPVGKEYIEHKTDNYSDYWAALGYNA